MKTETYLSIGLNLESNLEKLGLKKWKEKKKKKYIPTTLFSPHGNLSIGMTARKVLRSIALSLYASQQNHPCSQEHVRLQ